MLNSEASRQEQLFWCVRGVTSGEDQDSSTATTTEGSSTTVNYWATDLQRDGRQRRTSDGRAGIG
jgi:hypothetical protein